MTRSTHFKGTPLDLCGNDLIIGQKFPNFTLVGPDMAEINQSVIEGRVCIVLTVPSIDTPVCSLEVKRFNHEATALGDKVSVLMVSRDLPFALNRWCADEGVKNVLSASDYKEGAFGRATGTLIESWRLLSRAVFVLDSDMKVRSLEYVTEVSQEPDFEAALASVKELLQSSI